MNIFTLTILFPLLSFILLASSQGKYLEIISATIGVMGIGISTIITAYLVFNFYFYSYDYTTFVFIQELWSWFKINDLHVEVAFRLDGLSLIMLSVITGVGLIIHIYAIWYMKGNEGYSRFFAYTNLFMSNMILLVLSDNLLLMYLGWEGVGLCSYLLIGFYYCNSKNGMEACKAFIMTRFGDICLICALFIIYSQYHTFNLSELSQLLDSKQLSTNISIWVSVLILIGSVGKSAQIPLHTWLVGAMVGPTPVSALIHAATMVTSGVYLINRMHNFFLMTPCVLYTAGVIGAITLIISSCSALFQSNIKKILAYSTISQIGYMFLAIGSKNWVGSIFHLITHACSKALLFLAAGSLIQFCYNEQNIFKMGGLYRVIPFIYVCFLIGGASLSGLPIITSGFYSKELILLHIFSDNNDCFLLSAGLIGTFLTPIYIFRMIFIIFHGEKYINPTINYTMYQYISLMSLLLLSVFVGSQIHLFIINIDIYNHDYDNNQTYLVLISEILVSLGIWVASLFWLNSQVIIKLKTAAVQYSPERIIRYLVLFCHYGWGIDWLYKKIFIRPYLWIASKLFNSYDLIMLITNVFTLLSCLSKYLVCIENGKLNWYTASINIGVIVMLLIIFII